mmetsp:Transcript_61443/g.194493  ORF Transcript_61443/g.194493 Transcript_61443/m.194493 type:complete len:283 (-) Transcript_61443:15-863(-)
MGHVDDFESAARGRDGPGDALAGGEGPPPGRSDSLEVCSVLVENVQLDGAAPEHVARGAHEVLCGRIVPQLVRRLGVHEYSIQLPRNLCKLLEPGADCFKLHMAALTWHLCQVGDLKAAGPEERPLLHPPLLGAHAAHECRHRYLAELGLRGGYVDDLLLRQEPVRLLRLDAPDVCPEPLPLRTEVFDLLLGGQVLPPQSIRTGLRAPEGSGELTALRVASGFGGFELSLERIVQGLEVVDLGALLPVLKRFDGPRAAAARAARGGGGGGGGRSRPSEPCGE